MIRVIFLILLFLYSPLSAAKNILNEKNILVLHSYHHGLDWTDSISKGLLSVIRKEDERIHVYFEYLDSKRQLSPKFLDKTLDFFLIKHANTSFDAIVVSDNDALHFMNKNQNKLFTNTPVIFCGINHFIPQLISNISHVTGVKEKADHKGTLNLAQNLFQNRNKILVVLDDTRTADAIKKEVQKVQPLFKNLSFSYFLDYKEDELNTFKEENKDKLIVYLLSYNRDRDGDFFNYDESILRIKTLFGKDIPIFGSWDFFLDKGIVGGVITSGFNQGVMAGKMLLKVLNGEDANDIPIESNIGKDIAILDFSQIKHFKNDQIKSSKTLKVINKPETYFEKNKVFIFQSLLFLSLVFIILLILKLKKQEKEQLEKEYDVVVNSHKDKIELLQIKAQTDPLTGLLNRLTLEHEFFEMLQETKEKNEEFCLLIIDIDFFKNINDTYGHLFGDHVLIELAKRLKNFFRKNDFIFRYGGEEFIVIIPTISLHQALLSAQELRKSIFNNAFNLDEKEISLTISIGLAMSKDEDKNINDIISRADEALYTAKKNGRNKVEIST